MSQSALITPGSRNDALSRPLRTQAECHARIAELHRARLRGMMEDADLRMREATKSDDGISHSRAYDDYAALKAGLAALEKLHGLGEE